MKSTDQLMLSIGALLAAEREKRGIPVEKAAKETRMRPQRIRDMENDDLSHFTNPSYARMFIIAYAKYLDIPMPTIHDHLPDRGESGTEDYQYISAATHELPSLRRDLVSRPLRRGWLPTILVGSLVTLVVIVIVGVTYILINLPRLAPSKDEIARTPEPDATPIVVTKTYILQDPHLDNLPAATPAPVDPIATGTPPPATPAAAPATFTEEARIAAPPKPTPIVITSDQTGSTMQTSPAAATPAEADDRAFLLGSSPDQKPPATTR